MCKRERTMTSLTCGGPQSDEVMTYCPSIVNVMQLTILSRLASAAASIAELGDRPRPDLHINDDNNIRFTAL